MNIRVIHHIFKSLYFSLHCFSVHIWLLVLFLNRSINIVNPVKWQKRIVAFDCLYDRICFGTSESSRSILVMKCDRAIHLKKPFCSEKVSLNLISLVFFLCPCCELIHELQLKIINLSYYLNFLIYLLIVECVKCHKCDKIPITI